MSEIDGGDERNTGPHTHREIPVSLVVVDHVASFISDTMIGHFFNELASRNPIYHGVLPNKHRKDLLSMLLVHRTWTPIVQRVLRRRVRIHNPARLKAFLESPACGPWVVELWYIYDKISSDYEKMNLFSVGEMRSHWQVLTELLERLPNLRFLSVEVNDQPEPSWPDSDDEDDAEEEDRDLEDEEEDGSEDEEEVKPKPAASKKIAKVDLEEKAMLVEEMKYLMKHGEDEHVRVCRWECFDFRGIREALVAIGKLSSLEGLVLLCDATRLSSTRHKTYRTGRYLPYFNEVCEQLPNLSNLKYLHIRGWNTWYDPDDYEDEDDYDEDDEDEDVPKERPNKDPLSESLTNKSPPASLKTLIFEVPHTRFPTSHLEWLQVPQGRYALKNLFVRFNASCNLFHPIKWASSLGDCSPENLTTFHALENVRIEYSDPGQEMQGDGGLNFEKIMRQGVSRLIVERLTGIRSLHAAPIFLDAPGPFPATLTDLRIVLDSKPPDDSFGYYVEDEHKQTWANRERTLAKLVNDLVSRGSLPPKIYVTITDEEDDNGDTFCDFEDIDELLESVIEECADHDVELLTTEEMRLQQRIRDFLLYGQVRYPFPERKLTGSDELSDVEQENYNDFEENDVDETENVDEEGDASRDS